jgi:hypothetical protein
METSSEDHVERLLDQALEETFPASDPIAVSGEDAGIAPAQVGDEDASR